MLVIQQQLQIRGRTGIKDIKSLFLQVLVAEIHKCLFMGTKVIKVAVKVSWDKAVVVKVFFDKQVFRILTK